MGWVPAGTEAGGRGGAIAAAEGGGGEDAALSVVVSPCKESEASCSCKACSRFQRTSPIVGLSTPYSSRHFSAASANFFMDSGFMRPTNVGSMILSSNPFCFHCNAHSAKFTCSRVLAVRACISRMDGKQPRREALTLLPILGPLLPLHSHGSQPDKRTKHHDKPDRGHRVPADEPSMRPRPINAVFPVQATNGIIHPEDLKPVQDSVFNAVSIFHRSNFNQERTRNHGGINHEVLVPFADNIRKMETNEMGILNVDRQLPSNVEIRLNGFRVRQLYSGRVNNRRSDGRGERSSFGVVDDRGGNGNGLPHLPGIQKRRIRLPCSPKAVNLRLHEPASDV
nr:unknown protein [Ipomoea trifida]